jgi:hypothetical protein
MGLRGTNVKNIVWMRPHLRRAIPSIKSLPLILSDLLPFLKALYLRHQLPRQVP